MPRRFKEMIVRCRPLGQWFKVSPCWLWDKGYIPFLGAGDYIVWHNAEGGVDLPIGTELQIGKLQRLWFREGKGANVVLNERASSCLFCKLFLRYGTDYLPKESLQDVGKESASWDITGGLHTQPDMTNIPPHCLKQHCSHSLLRLLAQGLQSQKVYRSVLSRWKSVRRSPVRHREGWPAPANCLGLNRRPQSPVAAAGSVSTRSQAHCKAPTNLSRLQIRLWISTMFIQKDWVEFKGWEMIAALPRTGQGQTARFPSQTRPALISVQYLHQGWARWTHRSAFMQWQRLDCGCRPSPRDLTVLSLH